MLAPTRLSSLRASLLRRHSSTAAPAPLIRIAQCRLRRPAPPHHAAAARRCAQGCRQRAPLLLRIMHEFTAPRTFAVPLQAVFSIACSGILCSSHSLLQFHRSVYIAHLTCAAGATQNPPAPGASPVLLKKRKQLLQRWHVQHTRRIQQDACKQCLAAPQVPTCLARYGRCGASTPRQCVSSWTPCQHLTTRTPSVCAAVPLHAA